MTLLVDEVRVAPVVALNLWVAAGSADEPARLSGVSHFLEHMLLKGDENEPRGRLARTVQDAGGYLNAMTGSDHTAFYQVVPALQWEAVLEAQAGMLDPPAFSDSSVDAERSVIVEETRMSELNPPVFAWRRLMETAFEGSGYGRGITGTEETLAGIDGNALAGHFRHWYGPSNLVQVVVGDVDAEEVVGRARELFSRCADTTASDDARAAESTSVRSSEKCLPGWTPGSSVLKGKLRQPYTLVGFQAPPVGDPDIPVLDVLCGLLGLGRSSRLRKSLQTTAGLVSDIGASVAAHRDVGVVAVSAVGTIGASPPAIVEGVFREIESLRNAPVAAEEMRKSIRRLEAGYVLEHETVETTAMTLGFFATMGDHRYAEEYIDRLAAVTPDDVMRVANTYLSTDSAAMLAYVPEESVATSGGADALGAAALRGSRLAAKTTLSERPRTWSADEKFTRPLIARECVPSAGTRAVLPNGATLVVRRSSHVPIVSVAFGFRGGFCDEPDAQLGITGLTLKHMLRGTDSRPASILADDIEGLGTAISISADRDGFGFGASVLSKHLSEALDILGEVVCRPAFDPGDFERVRNEALAELGEAEDRPFSRTMRRLVPLLFPGHPYGRPLSGTTETLTRMAHEDTSEWHLDRFSTSDLFVCMTGDVSMDKAAAELERVLDGLPRAAAARGESGPPLPPAGSIDERLDIEGQSSVAVGFPGPRMGTRDSAAMHVATSALTMMGGRLWRELRERPPYAYSVRAMPVALRDAGALVGHVTTQPGQEEAAAQTFISEFDKLAREGLSEEELERGRRYLSGMLEISMQRGAARAASYVLAEVVGIGYEHIDGLPAIVREVTGDDVVRVARQYLTAEDGPAMAILRG